MLLGLVVPGCSGGPPEHRRVVADHGVVRLPRQQVGDGRVHFFTYAHDGGVVNFLVRTDGAGTLHAHLDACYSCYKYKKGFVVEGDSVVCIACRLEYPIADEYWDFIGACAPIPIHCEVDGDSVVVEETRLMEAAKYF